ncbi:hypothetical protein BT67DRAFT_109201 [Trichocladium antarcticum]|uniref:Uncharacterized protein n=1 Tax=Trichocladium antarcticum TaxID=1450529 RepID=A0AAN6ZGW4_9PEZI|nr:hypothetical protein BT67DRAFT_109201 [Trichocladium antarcticum]
MALPLGLIRKVREIALPRQAPRSGLSCGVAKERMVRQRGLTMTLWVSNSPRAIAIAKVVPPQTPRVKQRQPPPHIAEEMDPDWIGNTMQHRPRTS